MGSIEFLLLHPIKKRKKKKERFILQYWSSSGMFYARYCKIVCPVLGIKVLMNPHSASLITNGVA